MPKIIGPDNSYGLTYAGSSGSKFIKAVDFKFLIQSNGPFVFAGKGSEFTSTDDPVTLYVKLDDQVWQEVS